MKSPKTTNTILVSVSVCFSFLFYLSRLDQFQTAPRGFPVARPYNGIRPLINESSITMDTAKGSPGIPRSTTMPKHARETYKCTPAKRIVFLKTHKTASSTTASVFQRYGFSRNWSFAVGRTHVLARVNLLRPRDVYTYPWMKDGQFDILTNHARYNRVTMDDLLPNATYVTILRKPEDQLESAFSYFRMAKGMKLTNTTNPLKAFMDDSKHYFQAKNYFNWQRSRNAQLYDLGFDHKDDGNETEIRLKIAQIDCEFDLVMITEYYDHSLILLKKMLCLDYEDILYLPKGVRVESKRIPKDEDLIQRMIKWNHGDFLLYQHFNDTFWRKVSDYGPSFQDDVEQFRKINKDAFDDCTDQGKIGYRTGTLKPKTAEETCKKLRLSDTQFTKLIKQTMAERFGNPTLR